MERAPEPKPKLQPYEYSRGSIYLAYVHDGKKLYVHHGLGGRTQFPYPVAMPGGPDTVEIDGAAFDVLYKACGGDGEHFERERFERFLDAIIEFELKYSDNEERHQHRLPIEEEILKILTDGGYFSRT